MEQLPGLPTCVCIIGSYCYYGIRAMATMLICLLVWFDLCLPLPGSRPALVFASRPMAGKRCFIKIFVGIVRMVVINILDQSNFGVRSVLLVSFFVYSINISLGNIKDTESWKLYLVLASTPYSLSYSGTAFWHHMRLYTLKIDKLKKMTRMFKWIYDIKYVRRLVWVVYVVANKVPQFFSLENLTSKECIT